MFSFRKSVQLQAVLVAALIFLSLGIPLKRGMENVSQEIFSDIILSDGDTTRD